ncbi:MAG TPA: ribbon-helix-helix domain-containing protein [Planctomycetota bacterium]
MLKESRVTVKIPRPLYRRIQQVIENSGFSSPTDFIVFVLRDLMGEVEKEKATTPEARAQAVADAPPGNPAGGEFSPEELRDITRKLQNLGYLD